MGGRVEKSTRMCYRLAIDPSDEFMSCFCVESRKYPFELSQLSLGYTTLGLRTEIKAKPKYDRFSLKFLLQFDSSYCPHLSEKKTYLLSF